MCERYDLIAIGSGPAGRRAAAEAAARGARTAVVEREGAIGGAGAMRGTIPRRTLRAAIVELTGIHGRARQPAVIEEDDLLWRTWLVVEREQERIYDELRRLRIDLIIGDAAFCDPHTLEIRAGDGPVRVRADRIVIAVGTVPARPASVGFDGQTVFDADGVAGIARRPPTLVVVGAGAAGLECASMAAALGSRVTVIEEREQLLEDVDAELVETLAYHLRGLGVTFRLGERVETARRCRAGGAITRLRGGERIRSAAVLHTAGRQVDTAPLELAAAGLESDQQGRIAVDARFRTAQPHISAAGEVIARGCRRTAQACSIATIPELAHAGHGERELDDAGVPFLRGRARYRDLTRASIDGERTGLLKLLVHAGTRQLLGVHVLGASAGEIVHIGQAFLDAGLPADRLAEMTFGEASYADAYRVAAADACGRLPRSSARSRGRL